MCISAAIGAVGSIAGGLIGSRGANRAGDAQASAAQDAAAVQQYMYDQSREDMLPAMQAGNQARNALAFEMGIGARPYLPYWSEENNGWMVPGLETNFGTDWDAAKYALGGNDRYQGFEASPGYEFMQQEGSRAIDRSAAARGGLNSGATMRAQQRYGQGLAAQEYGNYLNRLAAMSGTGQTAASNIGSLGASSAANQGNALMAGGQARASGYMGQANALSGMVGNLSGAAGGMFGPSPFPQMWNP